MPHDEKTVTTGARVPLAAYRELKEATLRRHGKLYGVLGREIERAFLERAERINEGDSL